MIKEKSSFLIRALTLIVGAISNFVIASILLRHLGPAGFGQYVLLTSLPALIPFADFGMSANIFNHYADKASGLKVIGSVSETFYISSIVSSLLFLTITTITLSLLHFTNLLETITKSDVYTGLVILFLTFLAVPFSIAVKKMFAEGGIAVVIFTQGLIPPLVMTLVFCFFKFDIRFSSILFLFPCLAYLFSTYIIFLLSKINKDIRRTNFADLTSRAKSIFSLGGWSLCVTTVVALIWQTPKYMIQWIGTSRDLTEYSLMTLVLIPGLSFSGVAATWLATAVRRINYDSSVPELISRSRKSALLVSLLFSVSAFVGLHILSSLGLTIPNFKSQVIAFIILLLSPMWILPLSAFTNVKDLKWISVRIFPCFVLANFVFAFSFQIGYEFAIFAYTTFIFVPFYYFSNTRIRKL